MKLISACLLGINCRWDKKHNKNDKALELLNNEILIPVCPEQLGGLNTPRARQEIQEGTGKDVLERKSKVINENGEDVTEQFINGAEETLRIANLFQVREFIGKSHSPSCSCEKIYDGTFSGKLIDGYGVTTELLKRNGIKIIREENL
ncbi:MAG: DUF523 domain-containing protein [Candidatus Aminicenantes bacterium]|nr:DUF523 domain-containing protein [Candidatus Aminicenantes bacterium]